MTSSEASKFAVTRCTSSSSSSASTSTDEEGSPPAEAATRNWADHALPAARAAVTDPANAQWHVCEGTWFVGVDALPNDIRGRVGQPVQEGDRRREPQKVQVTNRELRPRRPRAAPGGSAQRR